MINISDVHSSIEEFVEAGDYNLSFDMQTLDEQVSKPIFENDELSLHIALGGMQKRSKSKWIFTVLKYKKYDDILVRSGGIKLDELNDDSIQNMFAEHPIRLTTMLKSSLHTCKASNMHQLSFSENGYSVNISRVSNRYVAIEETINAAKFEKRFDVLAELFNYLEYRRMFHSVVDIDVDVSPAELLKIRKEKQALENNCNTLYDTIILTRAVETVDENIDVDKFDIHDVKSHEDHATFSVSYDGTHMNVKYNDLAGMSVDIEFNNTTLTSEDIYVTTVLLSIIKNLENLSGYFKRWIVLKTQLSKFSVRTSKSYSGDAAISKLDAYDIATKISKELLDAKAADMKISNSVELSKVHDFRRFIVAEGANKNRRHCDIVVYAEQDDVVIEEYRASVEKQRSVVECEKFLKKYHL